MKKILLIVVGVVALVVIGGGSFLALKKPAQRPASKIQVKATPQMVARGAYLVEHVSDCVGCHSKTDPTKWGRPVIPGTEGGGGECWTAAIGFPGNLCAPNITPDPVHGIGKWTDGEVLRAMREGVDRNGHALFNVMPYDHFAEMSDQDAQSVVAYLRTLKPVTNQVSPRKLDFPLSVIVKFIPKPLTGPVKAPPESNTVAYGHYLVTIAGCSFCHTPVDGHGQPVPGRELSGGHVFKLESGGVVVSANLTPDHTGVTGVRTRQQFIALFRAYDSPASHAIAVDPKKNTVMPWLAFSGMTDADLGAIYDYLKTQKPIHDVVTKFPQAAVAVTSGT